MTASILPPAVTQFSDANGAPLAGGSVDFYIPGTLTRKTTWRDAAQSVPNTNPVDLDLAGEAIIFGSGSYRQIVKDSVGNTIWDQVTSATSDIIRISPSGAVAFHVNNSTGSNSNTGTVSSPFRTIQHAVNVVCDKYIIGDFPVTIEVENTGIAYAEVVQLRSYVGSFNAYQFAPVKNIPTIRGASVSVIVAPSGPGNCFTATALGTPWLLSTMKLEAAMLGSAIDAEDGSIIYFQGIDFGACPNGSHLISRGGSLIEALLGSYTISGGAQYHANAQNSGRIQIQTNTITLTGTPAFSIASVSASKDGNIDFTNATFVGAATGPVSLIDLPDGAILGPITNTIGMGVPGNQTGIFVASASYMETRKFVGDADYQIDKRDRYVAGVVNPTAPRKWTLPLASQVPPGQIIYLLGPAGVTAPNILTISCPVGDFFNGGGTFYDVTTGGKNTSVMSAGPGFWYRLII